MYRSTQLCSPFSGLYYGNCGHNITSTDLVYLKKKENKSQIHNNDNNGWVYKYHNKGDKHSHTYVGVCELVKKQALFEHIYGNVRISGYVLLLF